MPIGLYIQLQSAACTASRRRNFWQKGTFRSPYCVPKVPRGVASYPRMRRSVRWNYWRGGTTGSQHRCECALNTTSILFQISEYEKRLLEGIQHEVNTTYHPPLVSVSLALALPYLLLMFITTLVAIVGNVLIMAAFCVSKRVSVVGNEFILNLAVADLLIAVFANPFRMLGKYMSSLVAPHEVCTIFIV